jgi:hypothetical protein
MTRMMYIQIDQREGNGLYISAVTFRNPRYSSHKNKSDFPVVLRTILFDFIVNVSVKSHNLKKMTWYPQNKENNYK